MGFLRSPNLGSFASLRSNVCYTHSCLRVFLFQVRKYLHLTEEHHISWALMEAALSSVARTVIIPMQDVLELDNSARMNTPATQVGRDNVMVYVNIFIVLLFKYGGGLAEFILSFACIFQVR